MDRTLRRALWLPAILLTVTGAVGLPSAVQQASPALVAGSLGWVAVGVLLNLLAAADRPPGRARLVLAYALGAAAVLGAYTSVMLSPG